MDKEDHDHFKTIAAASQKPLNVSSTPAIAESSGSRPDQAYCLQRAKLLFDCYRKDEVHEPDTYCGAVALVLSEYSKHVVEFSTDPRTGIASKIKYVPNIAEIKEFLDDVVESINASSKRDRDLRQQFVDREEFEEIERNRKNRPTYEEIAADCARSGIMIGPVQHMTSAAEIKDFRKRHGITDAQWNKIPDRK